jgi:hypothetical protein
MPRGDTHPWFLKHPVCHHNIVWHWDQAGPAEQANGLRWYSDARQVATAIANGNTPLGAGMLAVYSPQQAWMTNVVNAARVLREGRGIGGPGSGIFASTLQRQAADRLLAGERAADVLIGPKIRAFAALIEHGGDADARQPQVVIDRHALSIVCGRPLTAKEYEAAPLGARQRKDGSLRHPHYDLVVGLYVRAATIIARREHRAVAAHQVQAVTWLVRQRLNQQAEQRRGESPLDKGRSVARARAEQTWQQFRTDHFPELDRYPGTGYLAAA